MKPAVASPPPAVTAPARRGRRLQARERLWIGVLLGALLPIALCTLLGTLALSNSRRQYEQRAELLSQNLAAAIEHNVSAHVEKIDLALTSVAVQLETQLASGQLDRGATEQYVRDQVAMRPELQSLRVTDELGEAIFGVARPADRPISFADREWFTAQRDRPELGLYMSRPIQSKVTGEWILSFSRRYRQADGRFGGAISAAVPLAWLAHELSGVDVGEHGAVVLRDTDLGLVARHPPGDPGGAGRVGDRGVSAALRELVRSGRAQATYHTALTADRVERTTSYRRLAALPLLVTVGLATEDYLADWTDEVRTLAVFGALIVGACTLGTAMVLRARSRIRATSQRLHLLAKAFEHSGEAIVITDRHDRIIEVNPAFTQRNGRTAAEVIGCTARSLLSPAITEVELLAVSAALRDSGQWRGELVELARDGTEIPIWTTICAVRDADGRLSHLVSNTIDLTEIKHAEAKIRHLAHHDTLTTLPNRVQLLSRLELSIAAARHGGAELAMLFIDMDRFKHINDTLGHPVGDALLVEVAQRLRGLVRSTDIVARLGGDEFVLVLNGTHDRAARVAEQVAHKVLAALGRPYHVQGHELHSTPSIGIGIFPRDGEDADALMKAADAAMYQAKASGRNNFQFFTAELRFAGDERLALEAGLRQAIERDELLLHYQPQRDVASGRLIGMEALLRWQHPERGMVPPLKFIPVAEDTGQIEAIGSWVIDQALAQVARWRATVDPRLRVAVNLSAQQLRSDAIVGTVALALSRHGLAGDALELEVTESTAMHDPARTAALLRELRELGVALAIDDFGTGYSSLAYLKQLPLSHLKLDRSFVTDIERDANDAAISRATIQLAHSLGLAVVAEGVETEAQLEFLRALRCDTVQGYLIARPLPPPQCERFLLDALRADAQAAVA